MPFSQQLFDEAIWRTVSRIKSGQVMGYGEVARAAGFPRHARMVSKAMARSTNPLPWYRVVRSNRTLAFKVGSEPYAKQKAHLEQEGVKVIGIKIVPQAVDEAIDLDKVLWGPQ